MNKTTRIRFLIFAAVFVALTMLLIDIEAVEKFYEYTRKHEDWELDDIILGAIAGLIAGSGWLALEFFLRGRKIADQAKTRLDLERELNATRRGQALGALAGGLAHSGNNLLQPILTLSRVAREQIGEKEPAREHLATVIAAAEKAADLFQSVLRFSRRQEERRGPTDIVDCLTMNGKLIATTIPSSKTLVVKVACDTAIVSLSESDLTDIVLVLLSNAGDSYAEGTGEIRMTVTMADDEPLFARLIVEDDGAGIEKEDLARIFEPFFTTKGVGLGTGLGLSIVAGLVQEAGGIISAISEPGLGTKISLKLPIVEAFPVTVSEGLPA